MSTYRNSVGEILLNEYVVCDGGLGSRMIFSDEKFNMPYFATFTLLKHDKSRAAVISYYKEFCHFAREKNMNVVLDTTTWRASTDWGKLLGCSEEDLAAICRDSVALLMDIRNEFQSEATKVIISGSIGPRGDGYRINVKMSFHDAKLYHTAQILTLKEAKADIITASTLTYVEESLGIALACGELSMPVIIMFTLETDSNLPSGMPLGEAIEIIDKACEDLGAGRKPVGYGINCAHPIHFSNMLHAASSNREKWLKRIVTLRPNASMKSHAELDDCDELDSGDPGNLAKRFKNLLTGLSHVKMFGGCCGTDIRHASSIIKACI